VSDGDRRRAPVRGLRVADVHVVVEEDRAADRRDGDGAVLHAQLVDRLGEVLVNEAVAAAGAVMGGVGLQALAAGVALELVVEDVAHDRTSSVARTCWTTDSVEGSTPP